MIHSFSIFLAEHDGLEESIILHSLYYWLLKNASNERNLRDGRYWTYNSAAALSRLFPYIKKDRLYRLLKSMQERGLILRENYNTEPMDKTLWYSITDTTLARMMAVGYTRASELTSADLDTFSDFAILQNAICKSAKAIPNINIPYKEKESIIINNNTKEKETECAKSPKKNTGDLVERDKKFRGECEKFVSMYGRDMIERFYLYWSEPNKSKTKMRWEMEKTWDIDRRMRTWATRSGIKPNLSKSHKDSDFEAFMEEFNRRQKV